MNLDFYFVDISVAYNQFDRLSTMYGIFDFSFKSMLVQLVRYLIQTISKVFVFESGFHVVDTLH